MDIIKEKFGTARSGEDVFLYTLRNKNGMAEIGRQPWIVYNLMRTSDAVSPIPTSSVGLSLIAFTILYTVLGVLDIYLLAKYALAGPKAQEA